MITVRDSIPADADEGFRNCHARGWYYAYKDFLPKEIIDNVMLPEKIQKRIDDFADYLVKSRADGGIHLTVLKDDKVIGTCSGGKSRIPDIAEIELYGIYLNPDFIGCGAGRALFEEFIDRIKTNGTKSFCLEVFSENKSMGFYNHMGGQVVKEYDPGEKYAHHKVSIVKFNI